MDPAFTSFPKIMSLLPHLKTIMRNINFLDTLRWETQFSPDHGVWSDMNFLDTVRKATKLYFLNKLFYTMRCVLFP